MKVTDMQIRERKDPHLILAQESEEYAAARKLIREYADSLGFSLDFQDIESELEHLDTFYGPPTGFILLARPAEEFVGIICLRNLGDFIAEIKRMYVKPEFRGQGLGRKLLKRTIDEAKLRGYRHLRLDTVPDMESATQLFLSSGFYEIEDYGYNPLPGARFMEFKL